ncbi:MAG: hypothetical protein EPO02_08830 [Nitrospirae bacterium]|nr:MAG: hypothetical protein EPO02_08830 [Nitrospirota bacterium]
MTMRVVPSLTVAVTEDGFRKRKRMLMLFPGLFAYALYKFLQVMGWHADIVSLLLASGLFSSGVALVCYAYGRQRNPAAVATEDGFRRLIWMGGRIGFFYAIQLSLMVLGLLQAASYFYSYFSYALHPAAPALMALIISSTSVARDAFEIGHVRFLQQQGKSFVTFPDGQALWALVTGRSDLWATPVAVAALAVGLAYMGFVTVAPIAATDLGQLGLIGVLVGLACTLAFVQGLQPAMTAWEGLTQYSWRELLRFFMWPGATFGWTYYLIMLGVLNFLLALPNPPIWTRILLTAGIGGLMSLYGYYLGRCRWQEEKLHATIPPSLLRCPFIVGVLTSKKA